MTEDDSPASSLFSPVSSSVVTAAVKPTPVVPLPVVLIALGAVFKTYRRSLTNITQNNIKRPKNRAR